MTISPVVTTRDMSRDNCWISTQQARYEDDKYIITVEAGFDFDFASIPWWATWLLPKNGQEYDRASFFHDALYASQALPKDESDNVFLGIMLFDGTNKYLAKAMYLAVKYGGHQAYNDTEDLDHYKKLVKVVRK
mgnify:FL=1